MYVQLISAVNDRPIFIRGHSDSSKVPTHARSEMAQTFYVLGLSPYVETEKSISPSRGGCEGNVSVY